MFSLIIRKLQKVSGTHYVAVPANWLHMNNLSKGSEIEFHLDENSNLILKPKQEV